MKMSITRKQQVKFTILSTTIACVILLIAFGAFLGVYFVHSDETVTESLNEALMNNGMGQEKRDMNRDPQTAQVITFIVQNDKLVQTSGFDNFDDESKEDVINYAYQVKDGKFKIENSYYEVKSKIDGNMEMYAVYNRTSIHNSTSTVCISVSIIFISATLLIALLSAFLSGYMLKPVSEAMEKQKDLVANASHELKTPLTIISTNLEVIKSAPESSVEENSQWVEAIDSQIGRMQGLITNMLELSKMEQASLPMVPLDFSELVEGTCLQFEPLFFEKNIKFVPSIQKGITINGDKASLERLVVLLLDNATKYSGEKGKVGCDLKFDKKNAILTVMNTGACISDEEAKHVFDRFYRTDGARENKDKQSFGLGLAIGAATVKAHNGTISCQGVKDKGTVFKVIIPLYKEPKNKKSIKRV